VRPPCLLSSLHCAVDINMDRSFPCCRVVVGKTDVSNQVVSN
jgi:hypothetical protein